MGYDDRDGEPTEGPNPARWKGHLEHLLPRKSKIAPVAHHAALPYRRIGDFFAELRQQSGIAARALEFLVLTWARTGEVIGAWLEEIEGDVWRVPPERMKSEREHVVPLCGRAVEIITEMRAILARRPSDYVFQGLKDGQPLSNMSLLMLLRRMGHAELTTHGFRATARTWAAAETAFPREMLEIALAHTMDDKTEAAYQRSDMFAKRRKLAEAGARYCDKPAQNGNGKVIAIGGA